MGISRRKREGERGGRMVVEDLGAGECAKMAGSGLSTR